MLFHIRPTLPVANLPPLLTGTSFHLAPQTPEYPSKDESKSMFLNSRLTKARADIKVIKAQ